MTRCRRDWIQHGLSWRALQLRRWIDALTFSAGPTAHSNLDSDAIQKTLHWTPSPSLTFQAWSLRLRPTHSLPPKTPYRGSAVLNSRNEPHRWRTAACPVDFEFQIGSPWPRRGRIPVLSLIASTPSVACRRRSRVQVGSQFNDELFSVGSGPVDEARLASAQERASDQEHAG